MTRGGKGMLSIGALSAATGIPVETIRSWERRYGFPVAERKPSGHRVYALDTVARLRLISNALGRGHRAAEVVAASESALESLLATLPMLPSDSRAPASGATASSSSGADEHFTAIRSFNAEQLKRSFHADWARLGPLRFVQDRAAPFLHAIGEAWSDGTLDVRHEHFASACLGDFLRTARIPMDDRATGPMMALATLPGEQHGMGLQMSAVVCAAAGWRALMLGTDTPIAQIAALAREAPIAAVAISCAAPRRRQTAAQLRTLRRRVPRGVSLLVGGAGAPAASSRAGVVVMPDLVTLDRWLHERAA